MSDYDLSIHSNPDASAWARFFGETFPPGSQVPDEGTMIGWFANAMMARHDFDARERLALACECDSAPAGGACPQHETPSNLELDMLSRLEASLTEAGRTEEALRAALAQADAGSDSLRTRLSAAEARATAAEADAHAVRGALRIAIPLVASCGQIAVAYGARATERAVNEALPGLRALAASPSSGAAPGGKRGHQCPDCGQSCSCSMAPDGECYHACAPGAPAETTSRSAFSVSCSNCRWRASCSNLDKSRPCEGWAAETTSAQGADRG